MQTYKITLSSVVTYHKIVSKPEEADTNAIAHATYNLLKRKCWYVLTVADNKITSEFVAIALKIKNEFYHFPTDFFINQSDQRSEIQKFSSSFNMCL